MACVWQGGLIYSETTCWMFVFKCTGKRPQMHRLLTGPHAQELPVGYRWLVLKGLIDLCPWYLIEEQRQAEGFRYELLREIASPNIPPMPNWFPFARRQDRDDFAGFVIEDRH